MKAVLFVSAPPDRLRRGIKAAEKEHGGTNHALQSTKTGLIPPSVRGTAGINATLKRNQSRGNGVEISANMTTLQQWRPRISATIFLYGLSGTPKARRDATYTGHGKRAAFLTVSLLLSACGGGGGTVPTYGGGATIPTFTSWSAVQPGSAVEAKGLGMQASYTFTCMIPDCSAGKVSYIATPEDSAASALFMFDAKGGLAGLSLTPDASTPATAVGFIHNPDPRAPDKIQVLAEDSDFVIAVSATSQAVISNPESRAWNYQSFGLWETGLGTGNRDYDNRDYGAMSVGAPTVGTDIPGSGTASNFTGKVVGSYITPEGKGHTVLATLNVGVDWNTQSLSFTTTGTQISTDPSTGTQISTDGSTFAAPSVVLSSPVNLEISGTLKYDPNINSFSGTLTTGGLSGSSTGQFYGPTAQELGGVFSLQGSDPIETYAGAYGAKQTP